MSSNNQASEIKGIDIDSVSRWLTKHVEGAAAPFQFELIAAGGSNLTFRVCDSADHCWALRRPPVAARLATAHDMRREWTIMSALGKHSDVPVPGMIPCWLLRATRCQRCSFRKLRFQGTLGIPSCLRLTWRLLPYQFFSLFLY